MDMKNRLEENQASHENIQSAGRAVVVVPACSLWHPRLAAVADELFSIAIASQDAVAQKLDHEPHRAIGIDGHNRTVGVGFLPSLEPQAGPVRAGPIRGQEHDPDEWVFACIAPSAAYLDPAMPTLSSKSQQAPFAVEGNSDGFALSHSERRLLSTILPYILTQFVALPSASAMEALRADRLPKSSAKQDKRRKSRVSFSDGTTPTTIARQTGLSSRLQAAQAVLAALQFALCLDAAVAETGNVEMEEVNSTAPDDIQKYLTRERRNQLRLVCFVSFGLLCRRLEESSWAFDLFRLSESTQVTSASTFHVADSLQAVSVLTETFVCFISMSSVSSSNLPKVGQVLSPAAKSSQTLMMAWTARWAMLDVLRCLRQHIGGYSQRPYLIQTSFIEKLARQVLKMLGRLTKCAASSDSECQEELLKVYMAIYHDFCCLTLLTVKWTTVSTNFERTLGVTDLSMMSSPLILLRYSANPIWRLGIRRQSLRSSASIICRFIADHLRRVHALFNPIELADTAECLDDYNSLMACSKFLSAVSDILRQSSSNRDNLDEGFLNLDEASSLKLADWCLTAGAIRAPALARMFLLPFIEQIASNSKNQKNCGRILKRLCSDSLIPRAYEDSDRMSLARCIVKWLIRMSCSHFTKCDTTESEFSRPQRCEIELRQFCIMQLCAIDHGSLEAFNCLVSLLDDSDVSIRDSTSAALATQCLNHEPFLVSHCKEDGKTQSKRVRHHSDGACTVEEEVIFSSEGRVVLLDSRRNPYKLLIQYLGQFRQSERHCIGNNREAKAVGQWAFHITLHIFVTCPFLAGREAILGKSTLLPQILDPKFKFITKLVAELLNIYQELQTKRTNLAKSFDSNSKSKLDGLLRITLCISKILAGVLSGSISDLSNEIPRAHPRVLRIAAPLLSTLRNDPSMSVRLEVLSVCAKLVGLDHFAANSNHVEMRKVTDLEGLTLVYNVVRQGSVSGYSDSHSNARVGDLEPRVVKLLGLILDFGRKWHLDAVYPQVLKFAHPETYSDSSQSWPNRVARAREREVGAFTTELQSLERNPFRQRITSIGGVRRAQMLKRLEKEEADVMQAFEGKRSSSILTVRPNMHQIKRSHTKSHFDDELDPVITIPAEILHEESIKVNDLMAKHSNDAEIFRDSALHFEATLESATSSTARVGRQKSGDFILNLDSNVPGDDASISFDILVREQQHQVELIERLSAKMVERSQRTSAFSRSLNEETRRTQQLNYSKIRPRGLSVDAQVRYRQYSMDPMENNFRQVDSPALTNGLPDGIQSTDSIEAAPLHGGQTDSHGGSDPADYVWTPIVFDMDQGATMSGIQTKRATESKLPSLLAEEIPRHPALVNLTPPEEGCNSLVARREVEDVRRIKSVVNAETSITPTRFAVPQTGVALPERVRSGQLESPKLSRPDGMSETSTSIHCFDLRNADDLAATATQESPAPVDRSTAAGSKANCRSTMDLSTSAASPPPTAERQIEGFQPPLSSASKLQIPVLESCVSYPENQSHHFHREGTMSLDELDCKTTPKMDLDAFLAGIQMATVPAVHSRDPRFNLNMKETTDSSKTVTSHVDSQSAFVTPIKPIPGAAYTKYTGASAFNCSTSSDSLSEIAKTPGSPHSFVWTEEATSYRDATRTELHPESLLDEAPLMVGTSNKRRHSPVEVDKGQESQQSEGLKSLEDHNQRAPVGEAERFETEDVSFGNGPSQVLSQLQLGGPSSTSINTSSVSASYMPSLIRPRVRSALELVLRHLVFFSAPNSRLQKFQTPNNSPSRLSKNLTTYQQHSGVSDEGGSIDYFDLYGSIGLAYGKLAFEVRAGSVSREDFSQTNEREYDERVKSRLSRRPGSSVYLKETSAEGLEALHPMLRNVFKLDMSLLTDFCQELDFSEEVNRGFSNKKLPLKDRLNLWLKGLTTLHRHLQPLSRMLVRFERQMRCSLSLAQAALLVRDQVSIAKMMSAEAQILPDTTTSAFRQLQNVPPERIVGLITWALAAMT